MSKFTDFFKQIFTHPKNTFSGSMALPNFKEETAYGASPFVNTWHDGDKFAGGFGTTEIQWTDYWTLRARSSQLFNENLYARGIVRRLVTNEINTGLTPYAFPDESVLKIDEDSLSDWSEGTENRFLLWGKSPKFCDWLKVSTFAEIQEQARLEALVGGDVLVVIHQNSSSKTPMIELIRGEHVRTPLDFNDDKDVRHGVELDKAGRQAGYYVIDGEGNHKRIPAYGPKTGRRLAWLLYGTDKRLDDVRGQPLLTIFLQSLKEIDRYRDAAQRKAVINSYIALFMQKEQDKPGTLPITNAAVRRDQVTVSDEAGAREFEITNHIPGLVMEELQVGEKPVAYESANSDINFAEFERAIIQAVAWASQIPPEILTLAFSNNYSASQAAINEFKIYLTLIWTKFGDRFCSPIYTEWLVSEVLNQKIIAPGLLDAWRDKSDYAEFAAWNSVDWYGSIKPSTDMFKQAKGSELLIQNGLSTHSREARINTGTKFTKNMKRLKRENELMVEARRPMAEFQQEFNQSTEDESEKTPTDDKNPNALEEVLDEYLSERGLLNVG
jgi:capsid protein